ncbi:hypothetical protein Lcho_4254 [Leptothrix cholodnii SP-6]|uniref:Uncharacterized protein n=1 Tax=Leptothrix cholodnii (strain ATCC 51168 / LMG 8142 / SP-6) TaxID=395495 RepID=B1XZE2_LEPCP|nr:hypothetical protein [Leptothrix cholodnii]ACB36505.1 hypothetical protein Lcho_4254 [Leptothrix cholodnii SP-6]
MNTPRRITRTVDLWAVPLLQRKRELVLRSDALRLGLAAECREGWQALREPLDHAWTWRTRLLRVWQAGQSITARRPWLLLAVPLAWRLLRRVLRRRRSAASTTSSAVRWAGRLSTWWSAWRVLKPVVQAWLDESGPTRPGRTR